MDTGELLYSTSEGTARITLNREAQRNSLTPEMLGLFLQYLDRARDEESVRALVVTGAGEKAFCSGASLGMEMNSGTRENFRNYALLMERLSAFPKPTVARINGLCLAGGIGLILACDIAVAAESARFGTPEVNVGLWPMMIGALIYRNVSRKKAMKMVLLGQTVTAGEAEAMGLITDAVPAASLDETVDGILKILTTRSPAGIRMGKEAFGAMEEMPLKEALEYLSDQIIRVASTEDAAEGIRAFLEKREPRFTGR